MTSSERVTIECRVGADWVTCYVPEDISAPNIQVRWAGHVGSPTASGPTKVTLEFREEPDSEEDR
jgi:hypothetical protein